MATGTEQANATRADRNGQGRDWSTAELADDPAMVVSVLSEWENAQHAVLRAGVATWLALCVQPVRLVVDRFVRI